MEQTKDGGTTCKCPCHRMLGILIALIGLTFLLGHIGILSEGVVGVIWPVLLILIGLKKSCSKGVCKCCPDAAK